MDENHHDPAIGEIYSPEPATRPWQRAVQIVLVLVLAYVIGVVLGMGNHGQ